MYKIERNDLKIYGYEFLQAFKQEGQDVYFRMIKDCGKGFPKNDSCLMLEGEYKEKCKVFKEYQEKAYGIFYVLNNGGQKCEDITSLTAHFADADAGKEVIGIGLDGKPIKRNRTLEEIEKYKQEFLIKLQDFELEPSIIVETKNGFHVYWLLNKEFQEKSLFTAIQKSIVAMLNTDPKVVNLARILRVPGFLHLKNPAFSFLVKTIKFDTRIKYFQSEIATAFKCDVSNVDKKETKKADKAKKSKVKPIVSSGDININQIEVNEPKEFCKVEEMVEYLRGLDIAKVLGLDVKNGQAFNCIFHDDNNPSAVVAEKNGIYKYFCNSSYCAYHDDLGLDIIDIICKKESLNFLDAVVYLSEKLGIENPMLKWKETQKQKYIQNLERLSINSLSKESKDLYKVIRFGIRVLYEINIVGLEHTTFENFIYENQNIFFFSNRYLAKRLGIGLKQTNQYINLFCVLKLINKVPVKYVPTELWKEAKTIAKSKGQRCINFYTVIPVNEVETMADTIAKEMLDRGYSSIKSMSKAFIENLFDEEVAKKIYGYSNAIRNQSNISVMIEKFLIEMIKDKGYVKLEDIYNHRIEIEGRVINKETKYINFKRLIPVMIDKYDFVYEKSNKELCGKLGLGGYSYVLHLRFE